METLQARPIFADCNLTFVDSPIVAENGDQELTHVNEILRIPVFFAQDAIKTDAQPGAANQTASGATLLPRLSEVPFLDISFQTGQPDADLAQLNGRSPTPLTTNAPIAPVATTQSVKDWGDDQSAATAGNVTSSATATATTIYVELGTTAAQLQTLIDTAPPGTVLQLRAGHYSFNQSIVIDRDDISVIGAGAGQTFVDMPASLGKEAFNVGDGGKSGTYRLAADVGDGGKVMTLTGSHNFEAGDYVYLSRDSTTAYYDSVGDNAWRNTDVPLRTSIVQVTAVDGQRITFSTGVHFDFTTGETTVTEISMAENVTLGGFTVDYGLSTSDPSDFSNRLGIYDRNAVIDINGTAGLNLFDIRSTDVPSLGVNVGSSVGLQADRITMTGAHNKGDGGNGYGLQIRDVYDSWFTNISDQDMRHSVVFSSWQSSVGNLVHVTQTDRDINFHGSPDHDNVVMVDRSIRDANSDIISPTLFINTEGTHYGSVTAANANVIRFGHVVGTRLGDNIIGYDNGAWLQGAGGHDTLTGGAGNDLLSGGTGSDVMAGGGGQDIAAYGGRLSDFLIIAQGGGRFEVRDRVGGQGTDLVSDIEWLLFDNGALRLSDLSFLSTSAVSAVFGGAGTYDPGPVNPPAPIGFIGTSGKDIFDVTIAGTTVQGLGDWDVVRSTVNFTMADDVERLDLLGTLAINGTGGATSNLIFGNDASNILDGMAGNDKLWGRFGNDSLRGGDGDDLLYGEGGNDRIDGGAGQDKLTGGAGADLFVFRAAADTSRLKSDKLLDFQSGVDKIDLSQIDANTTVAGDQAFVWRMSDTGPASLWFNNGYLYGDLDANGVADLAIYLGTVPLVPSDIAL